VNNHTYENYQEGINDCDIWIETVLNEAGINLPDSWSAANDTTVATHIQEMEKELPDTPGQGTNIVFLGETHVLMIGLNEDGTVDAAHQGHNQAEDSNGNNWYSRPFQYNNLQAFTNSWGANGTLRYVPVDNGQTPDAPQTATPPPVINPPLVTTGGRKGL
jgi:hypothetical protein